MSLEIDIPTFFRHFAMRKCKGLPESQKEIRLRIYPLQNQEVWQKTGSNWSTALCGIWNGLLLECLCLFFYHLTDAMSKKNVSKLEKVSWQIIPLKQQSIKKFSLCQRIKELNITHWCPEYGYKNRNSNRKGEYKTGSLLQQRCFREHFLIACIPNFQTKELVMPIAWE